MEEQHAHLAHKSIVTSDFRQLQNQAEANVRHIEHHLGSVTVAPLGQVLAACLLDRVRI